MERKKVALMFPREPALALDDVVESKDVIDAALKRARRCIEPAVEV